VTAAVPRYALRVEALAAEGRRLGCGPLVLDTALDNVLAHPFLKAWIDHIVRIRRTFRSTRGGKIGILRDRPLVVVSAHGGYCGDAPPVQPDFLTPYLRAVFETIGIRSVEFLRLEGLGRGPEAVERALDRANTWMECRLPRLLDEIDL
jgi:FMN-dependent NADH-azoreductase